MAARSKERIQFLADIICTAVEGGTGYWAQVSNYRWDCEPELTTATLHDMEDGKTYPLTIESIADGIAKVIDPEFKVRSDIEQYVYHANRENDGGDIDAEIADIIVQAHIFGKIVYG